MSEKNEAEKKTDNKTVLSKISQDRSRSNFLKKSEQRFIAYLVQRVPSSISSDMLTAIGFMGSIIVSVAFILGENIDRLFLLFGLVGFFINWVGDSLDGRLAYYRNKPRKWYGFTLDFTVDWLTNIVIGLGLYFYVNGFGDVIIFVFIMLYGWAMLMALLRYKLINEYSIDTASMGPTEVRLIICCILIIEVIFPGTLIYFGVLATIGLFIINICDFVKLLKIADQCDKNNKKDLNI